MGVIGEDGFFDVEVPIFSIVHCHALQALYKLVIQPLDLAVSLRMAGRGVLRVNLVSGECCKVFVSSELGSIVREDLSRHSVRPDDVFN